MIAAGISNGGGVVLRALEVDRGPPQTRWFDGAVAIEPSVAVRGAGRPLYDYATLASLLQPCAVLAEPDTGVPALAVGGAARAPLEAWCADLAAAGDVGGADTAAWAAPGAMPCGLGFAYVDAAGSPRTATDAEWARLYADSNGIPPTGGIALLRQDPDVLSVAAALRAAGAELRYYELVHAQHFDAFIGLPGMASRHVPTQPWLLAAMDRVHARLSGGAALPPSQVLRGRTLSVPE